jgi:uncharacterized protein (DUF2235 family)
VFGFSRKAYTARALGGLLHAAGLLTVGNDALIPYAIRMMKQRPIDFAVLTDFKKTFSRECKLHFMGVWTRSVQSDGSTMLLIFHLLTAKNPDLGTVRHAVSIDERRAFFRENLFIKAS